MIQNKISLSDRRIWRAGTKHLTEHDPVLAKVIEKMGPYRFKLEDGYYEALVGAIVFQQLAGRAAEAILSRFKQLYDGRIPNPREYLGTDEGRLRSTGLSPQKISYIRDLCEKLEGGVFDLNLLSEASDEEVVRQLDVVKGVGRWTAEMFLIFVLGRPDVLPVDDLGLRKAVQKIYRLRKLPTKEKFEILAKNWHPYCSIATLYLWRSQEAPDAPVKW